MHLRDLTLAR